MLVILEAAVLLNADASLIISNYSGNFSKIKRFAEINSFF